MAGIEIVRESDLRELLPLMRGYCDFYSVSPADGDLLAMSRALIADPEREGFQVIGRDAESGHAMGFATVFWSWQTSTASRIGVMNDLFVLPVARGSGLADALIGACAERVRTGGGRTLEWVTAADNLRAQRVYDRVGARRDDRWRNYSLDL